MVEVDLLCDGESGVGGLVTIVGEDASGRVGNMCATLLEPGNRLLLGVAG